MNLKGSRVASVYVFRWPRKSRRGVVRLAIYLFTLLTSFQAFAQASLSDGVDPTTASAVQLEQAQRQFAFAKTLYAEGRHTEALAAFSRSRAIVASPNARLYRARCQRELGQLVQAYAEFGRTMVEALELAKQEARYGRAAAAAREERKLLEGRLAFLRVNVLLATDDTRLYVAGEEMRRGAWSEPFPVVPGGVLVTLKNGGNQTQRTVVLAAGQRTEVSVSVPPSAASKSTPGPIIAKPAVAATKPTLISSSASDHNGGPGPWFYATAGVAVVGLGAFAVLGAMSRSSYDEAAGMCDAAVCDKDPAEIVLAGKKQQRLANVGLVVGGLAAAAALTIVLMDGSIEEGPPTSVSIAIYPSGITLQGSF